MYEKKTASENRFPGSENRFRYLGDTLFLVSLFLWFLNRFFLRPNFDFHLLFTWWSDFLCVPITLPPLLLLLKLLRARPEDESPTVEEIMIFLLIISFAFEILFPCLPFTDGKTYSDPLDIVAYTIGGIFSGIWWKSRM